MGEIPCPRTPFPLYFRAPTYESQQICVVCRARASARKTPPNPEKTPIFETSADRRTRLTRRSADFSNIGVVSGGCGVFHSLARARHIANISIASTIGTRTETEENGIRGRPKHRKRCSGWDPGLRVAHGSVEKPLRRRAPKPSTAAPASRAKSHLQLAPPHALDENTRGQLRGCSACPVPPGGGRAL